MGQGKDHSMSLRMEKKKLLWLLGDLLLWPICFKIAHNTASKSVMTLILSDMACLPSIEESWSSLGSARSFSQDDSTGAERRMGKSKFSETLPHFSRAKVPKVAELFSFSASGEMQR